MSEADGQRATSRTSAQVYDFVHPGHRLDADWPVLEMVHQRFVAVLSKRLSERFHLPLACDAAPTQRARYPEFVAALDGRDLVHEYSLGSLPGVALLSVDTAFVSALVDGWFGGTPGPQASPPQADQPRTGQGVAADEQENAAGATPDDGDADRDAGSPGESAEGVEGDVVADANETAAGVTLGEIVSHRPPGMHSATERRALGYVLETVSATLAEAWSDIATFTPAVAQRTSVERLARGGYGDVMIACPFTLAPNGQRFEACLTFAAATLEPFGDALAREDHSHPVRDSGFREALGEELLGCELELQGVLAETRITLAELMAMKPGDFIPLRDVQNVSFQSQSMPLFDARVGKSNGRVSASLSRWHLPTRS